MSVVGALGSGNPSRDGAEVAAHEPRRARSQLWRPTPALLGCSHPSTGPGSLDESARRLSHSELAVALQLVAEGHVVRSLDERRGTGPVADMLACTEPVEVKSFLPGLGRVPGALSVYNKLVSAKRQSANVVLWARHSGLSENAASSGVALFAQRPWNRGRIDRVRIVGDGFDLTWSGSARLARRAMPTPGERGVGL